jgi:aldose 1-epimerase
MSRYAIESEQREGEALVSLRDTATGAAAQIWPGCGNNCFSLTLPRPSGAPGPAAAGLSDLLTVIAAPPTLDEIRKLPSWWGIPLLFPFPGVVPRGEYEFQGQHYRLGRPDQQIVSERHEVPGARRDYHGFVMDLPWQVAHTVAGDDSAVVRSTLDATDHPETLDGFPFPFRVEAAYTLDASGLRLDFRAENSGSGPLPFGFGTHPYFKIPPGAEGTPRDCLVCIPASRRWNGRAAREAMERGEPVSWEEVCPLISEALDLRTPRPFVEGKYNGMYAGLTLVGGKVEAFVRDAGAGAAGEATLETVMRASPNFPYAVLWSPPGRQELCFEAWTCPGNVFNLAAHNVPGNSLIVLQPGESWQASIWISLRPATFQPPGLS